MSHSQSEFPAIHASEISKSFGGAAALTDVSLEVQAGHCHAVVGENGAGKSTLMKVMAGLLAPDTGSVLCFGSPIEPTPGSAIRAGLALVHQERSLVPEMTVAENISLGATPTQAGFIKRSTMADLAKTLLDRVGVDISPSKLVSQLSSAQQQMVEIAKALRLDPRVLILDEPSASLTPLETERLIEMLKGLAKDGIAIIYISHRLPEIYALCDFATVLRDGRLVDNVDLSKTPSSELVRLMVGRKLEHDLHVERKPHTGQLVLEAEGLNSHVLNDVSLKVHAGEIVGLGGLVGAGRSEIVRTILGLDPRTSGQVFIHDESGKGSQINTYAEALAKGSSYLPEERRTEGVLIDMSIEFNISLPTHEETSRWGVGNNSARVKQAETVIQQVDVQPPKRKAIVNSLSGGNQQKVAFGKWLPANPRFFVLDEPTRGVDVGAKSQMHDLVRELADKGVAVLIVSSDLPELLSLSDRVLVVRDGTIVGDLNHEQATETSVMELAVGSGEKVGSDV